MKYTVITEASLDKLIKLVNKWIQDGWNPVGGAGWRSTKEKFNDDGIYFQAMIKSHSNWGDNF